MSNYSGKVVDKVNNDLDKNDNSEDEEFLFMDVASVESMVDVIPQFCETSGFSKKDSKKDTKTKIMKANA